MLEIVRLLGNFLKPLNPKPPLGKGTITVKALHTKTRNAPKPKTHFLSHGWRPVVSEAVQHTRPEAQCQRTFRNSGFGDLDFEFRILA